MTDQTGTDFTPNPALALLLEQMRIEEVLIRVARWRRVFSVATAGLQAALGFCIAGIVWSVPGLMGYIDVRAPAIVLAVGLGLFAVSAAAALTSIKRRARLLGVSESVLRLADRTIATSDLFDNARADRPANGKSNQ